MVDHLEFWTIATVVVALGWRRWRRAYGRPSPMAGRSGRPTTRARSAPASVAQTRRNPQGRGRPRVLYSQRDLERAYRAGVDTGAAQGPTDATRRRWAREGFEVPQSMGWGK